MPRKLTLEYVKDYIEGFGYVFLSKEYINIYAKLELQCDKGHQYKVVWKDFQQGCRCSICAGNKKKTIEEIKEYTEKLGYKCLSKEYVNNSTKLLLVCPQNHEFKMAWNNFHNQGQRCSTCSGKKKKTIEEVKQYVEEFGYKCLSEKYVNKDTKLKIECDKGHQRWVTWASIKYGNRCTICSGNEKRTIEEIKQYVEELGYKCLSTVYENAYGKLKIECDQGHLFYTKWNRIQRKHGCPICARVKKKTIEEVKQYIEEFGYICLSDSYKNAHTKLDLICPKGHNCRIAWSTFNRGVRCRICSIEKVSGENNYRWKDYSEEDRKNITLYGYEVDKLTNINYRLHKNEINPNKLKRGRYAYHIDHIYSIRDGFDNGILPEIISSPINLQMLKWSENIAKSSTSHTTKEELFEAYNKFNQT